MKVLLTGADGFLGWHTRTRLFCHGEHQVVPVGLPEWDQLGELIQGCDAVIHLAGVNDHTNESANVEIAERLVAAAQGCNRFPTIVYSNTVHADTDTPYGNGKRRAAELLAAAAHESGANFTDVRLPNLFGEHARPNYNTFTASFIDALLNDREPQITDREISLLHAQDAAQALIDGLTLVSDSPVGSRLLPSATQTSVVGVYEQLKYFNEVYAIKGELPQLADKLAVNLFNSFRAAMFPQRYPIRFTRHTDERGAFVEVARLHGGGGQTSFSTTKPGITRGNHFHLRKVERFVVVSGQALISLRRIFTDEVVSFDVTGDQPCAVDMPIGWSHNITNTGADELTTLFWINELFDPADPDTFALVVEATE